MRANGAHDNLGLWLARLAWAVLPVTTGGALSDAIHGFPIGPMRCAIVVAWAAWAAALLALFTPHPNGVTYVRIVAPLAIACAVLATSSTSAVGAGLAIATTLLASLLSLSPIVSHAGANALAYGDELRFPLRIPTPLLLGPLPLGVAIVGAGALAGPFLLADSRIAVGIVATVAGLPLAAVTTRSIHALSRRWLVLVPAGIAIVDAFTLLDPVLLRRAEIARLGRVHGTEIAPGTVDLRMGTLGGNVTIELHAPQKLGVRRGRAAGALVDCNAIVLAAVRADLLIARAHDRRLTTG